MSYSPRLATNYNNTNTRTNNSVSHLSGMCSVCTEECFGGCEIGLSAVRGAEATYPYNTKVQQFASEKIYPFDYSHFNINGRVFGYYGIDESTEYTNVNCADTRTELGEVNTIKMKAPFILPAIAKLNWRDYYAGAAMYGIPAVIGESAIRSDAAAVFKEHKILDAPILTEMEQTYRKYQSDYGDIILQVNADDIAIGVPEYALKNTGIKSIEIKFGQAAKGIQHMAIVNSLEEARKLKQQGYIVDPNPEDEDIAKEYIEHQSFHFYQYGRLPYWTDEKLEATIQQYRELGATNIFFKMAGYDEEDIQKVLTIASNNRVTMITFDGAGGGTGHSPCKMMDEWGLPTIELENLVYNLLRKMESEGKYLPSVAIAGGFTTEDRIFKALALGEQYISNVAIGRGAMAAAMSAKKIGELIKSDKLPDKYKQFGNTVDEIFFNAPMLFNRYGRDISTGAIGVYSYLERLNIGLKQLMTLNRKFKLNCINRSDLIPLTAQAREICNNK